MRITDLLTELNMSPTGLKAKAAGIDALVGMEFEMYVPGAAVPDENDLEMVPDMDQNTRPYDIEDILTFYSRGDNPMGRNELARLKVRLQNEYDGYITQEIDNFWRDEGFEYFKENFDTDDLDEGETIEDVWEEQGRQYWTIQSRFVEEQREDPPSERDWLRDRGWTSMEDINDHFGFTWPYWKQEEPDEVQWEMDDIAESFSVSVGRGVSVEGDGGNGEYGLTTDGSLNAPYDPKDAGLEFISPPLTIDEMISDLQKVRRWARIHRCYTNEETGLHINVSIRGANWDNLDYVKLAILLGDQHVLEQFGRTGNMYAASAFEKIETQIRNSPDTAMQMLEQMRKYMNAIASRTLHDLKTEKYTSINLKLKFSPEKQRVEFRSPGGDYLGKNFDLIENTILRFVVALNSALDVNSDRREYISKLYKLLQKSNTKTDILKYYSLFVTDELKQIPKLPYDKLVVPEPPTLLDLLMGTGGTSHTAALEKMRVRIINSAEPEKIRLLTALTNYANERRGQPGWKALRSWIDTQISYSELEPTQISKLRAGLRT